MPRGIPNTKPNTKPKTEKTPSPGPEPLIIMHPAGDGWQFNASGIDMPEVIRALRLSLIHFAAQQSGVTTIEATISPRNILLATPTPAARRAAIKPKPAQRSANGRRTAAQDYDEDDDPDAIDLEELMGAR